MPRGIRADERRRLVRRKILFCLFLLVLVFIWGQSCMPVTLSREESSRVLTFLKPFLEWIFGRGKVTHHLVRKLAHFAEYFVLGCCLSALLPLHRRGRLLALGLGLLAALIDETIQIFSGRGDQISDVWLDFSGAAAGVLLLSLILWLIGKLRSQRDAPALR